MRRNLLSPVVATAALAALCPASSLAARTAQLSGGFEVKGGGFGHGIGMSQYGAMGYALHGWNYQAILGHYYQATSLGRVSNSSVTVLLGDGAASIRGASAADGHTLSVSRSYGVTAAGSKLTLMSGGRRVGSFSAPLKLTGSALKVAGKGRYAGSLLFYPDGSGGVETVDAVSLEDYVRGVIAEEMPARWPQQALDAQAVAARTYVLADAPVDAHYDVYSDTRSQMYGGVSAETSATDAAETATSGQVVESGGRIIPTYFFSSSGGHTESIQNVWLGVSPTPYLVGVADPYDDSGGNPYYRWSDKLSLSSAARHLAGLYKGTFRGIKVLSRGRSPRIISASVIGTRGHSIVSGTTLEEDLGTPSTWMSFTTISAKGTPSSGSATGAAGATSPGATSGAGVTGSTHAGAAAGPVTGGAGITDLARAPQRVLSDR